MTDNFRKQKELAAGCLPRLNGQEVSKISTEVLVQNVSDVKICQFSNKRNQLILID